MHSAVEALLEEYRCPITREVMRDPVVLADGHSYERDAIQLWLATHDTSPMTGKVLDSKSVTTNVQLRQLLTDLPQAVRADRLLLLNQENAECKKHIAWLGTPEADKHFDDMVAGWQQQVAEKLAKERREAEGQAASERRRLEEDRQHQQQQQSLDELGGAQPPAVAEPWSCAMCTYLHTDLEAEFLQCAACNEVKRRKFQRTA